MPKSLPNTGTPASNPQATIDRYEITDIHSNLQCTCKGVYHAINALSLAEHATRTDQIQSLINIAIDSLLAHAGVLDCEVERLGNLLGWEGRNHANI